MVLFEINTAGSVGGFVANLGLCGSVRAELWAAYLGLSMAWSKGFRDIRFEMDSLMLMQMFTEGKCMGWHVAYDTKSETCCKGIGEY